MSAIDRKEIAQVELVDDAAQFFAPAATDVIDSLLSQYRVMRAKVERVADVMNGPDLAGALHYFAECAGKKERHLSSSVVESLFDKAGALAHLDAAFWSKTIHLTDVLDCMPQARRDEWHAQIHNPVGRKANWRTGETEMPAIPEFTEEAVRSTIEGLLLSRERFFAERVDGIFRGLSKTHVTNTPEGFCKRMILSGVTSEYGYSNHSRAGTINDLRCVIAKFMGTDAPPYDATGSVVSYARRYKRGEWITLDGGALRIRCYDVGTAHLEVHPDIAHRLNCVLAQLHPAAIPSKFRAVSKKASKAFAMLQRPLPYPVRSVLAGMAQAKDPRPNAGFRENSWVHVPGCWEIYSHSLPDEVVEEACRVLESIGGARVKAGRSRFAFDYDPGEVVREIVASGCIPDRKTHQFYPTPASLAAVAVELAEVGEAHTVLEPSAGQGGLADLLPKERTTCVELSRLHCEILCAKGFGTIEADFLAWAQQAMCEGTTFDRVVMNPPFSDGRAQAHTQAAAHLVAVGGVLVAVLPASMRNKDLLPGFDHEWSKVYENEFAGTSVSVVILKATRAA